MRPPARIVACLLLAAPLTGQAERVANCEARESERERRTCYAEAYKEADRRLGDAYRKLMNELGDDYERLLLRHAQINWKRYTDAQCDLETYAYRSDAASASMRDRCLAEHMEARQRQIESYRPRP